MSKTVEERLQRMDPITVRSVFNLAAKKWRETGAERWVETQKKSDLGFFDQTRVDTLTEKYNIIVHLYSKITTRVINSRVSSRDKQIAQARERFFR